MEDNELKTINTDTQLNKAEQRINIEEIEKFNQLEESKKKNIDYTKFFAPLMYVVWFLFNLFVNKKISIHLGDTKNNVSSIVEDFTSMKDNMFDTSSVTKQQLIDELPEEPGGKDW